MAPSILRSVNVGNDAEEASFDRAMIAFVAHSPACWPYVGRAVADFVARAVAREVGATLQGAAEPLVYVENSAAMHATACDLRPVPRIENLAMRDDVIIRAVRALAALGAPPMMELEIEPGVYRFSTELRRARIRFTAALLWLRVPGHPARFIPAPLETLRTL